MSSQKEETKEKRKVDHLCISSLSEASNNEYVYIVLMVLGTTQDIGYKMNEIISHCYTQETGYFPQWFIETIRVNFVKKEKKLYSFTRAEEGAGERGSGTGTLSQEVTGHYHTVSQGLSRHITQVSNPTPNSILFRSAMLIMDYNNVLGFLDFIQFLKPLNSWGSIGSQLYYAYVPFTLCPVEM